MKLIKPYYEIIEQQPNEIGMLKHIETCGRVAWKSEERITDDSHIKFIDMLKGVNHGSVLEHGTIYLHMKGGEASDNLQGYYKNKYSIVKRKEEHFRITDLYITTNYMVLVENGWLDDLKYQCEPTKYHEKRITIRFVCDRGVSHEFVRHRTFSFTQESTRYCNYSKDKFGNELTFIIPCWLDISEGVVYNLTGFENSYSIFELNGKEYSGLNMMDKEEDSLYRYLSTLNESEVNYVGLLNNGWKPQQARAVLPNSLKTELIMTGFISDWKHFFSLRSNKYGRGGAHPQADELATPLYEEFIKLELI